MKDSLHVCIVNAPPASKADIAYDTLLKRLSVKHRYWHD